MNKLIKILKNGGIFVIILSITIWIICKNNNYLNLINTLKSVNIVYVIIGLSLMFIYSLSESINIKTCLEIVNEKPKYRNCFKYAMVSFFFSAITPSSTGSQPMQIYYMNKDKIKVSSATMALLIQLSSFIFATILYAILGFIISRPLLMNMGNIKYLLLIGLFINMGILLLIISSIFMKKVSNNVIELVINFLQLLHIKNIYNIKIKLSNFLNDYQNCAKYIKTNKAKFALVLISSLIQLLVMHSVTYFVYKSFGLNIYSFFSIISLQSVLYISVSYLPFPGAVGVSESAFLILYKILFSAEILKGAMVLNRGINFYIYVLFTGLVLLILYIINYIKTHKKFRY